MKFEGKCAIVTGAGRGIGETYAQALAQEGASVVIAELDFPAGQQSAAKIADGGGAAIAVEVDVADEHQVQQLVAAATAEFGGVDILVNNAALHLMEYAAPCTTLGTEKWRRMFDVNLTGPLLCATACRPSMQARGGGVIVNQSSMAAYWPAGAYHVAKLALNGLTVALADEFAVDNIRVNGIAPGVMASQAILDGIPEERRRETVEKQMIKRPGQTQDLVGPLLFLCSQESDFVTGQTLLVDGGYTKRV